METKAVMCNMKLILKRIIIAALIVLVVYIASYAVYTGFRFKK